MFVSDNLKQIAARNEQNASTTHARRPAVFFLSFDHIMLRPAMRITYISLYLMRRCHGFYYPVFLYRLIHIIRPTYYISLLESDTKLRTGPSPCGLHNNYCKFVWMFVYT